MEIGLATFSPGFIDDIFPLFLSVSCDILTLSERFDEPVEGLVKLLCKNGDWVTPSVKELR